MDLKLIKGSLAAFANDLDIDGTRPNSNSARLLIEKKTVDGIIEVAVFLQATRDIKKDEEITTDYYWGEAKRNKREREFAKKNSNKNVKKSKRPATPSEDEDGSSDSSESEESNDSDDEDEGSGKDKPDTKSESQDEEKKKKKKKTKKKKKDKVPEKVTKEPIPKQVVKPANPSMLQKVTSNALKRQIDKRVNESIQQEDSYIRQFLSNVKENTRFNLFELITKKADRYNPIFTWTNYIYTLVCLSLEREKVYSHFSLDSLIILRNNIHKQLKVNPTSKINIPLDDDKYTSKLSSHSNIHGKSYSFYHKVEDEFLALKSDPSKPLCSISSDIYCKVDVNVKNQGRLNIQLNTHLYIIVGNENEKTSTDMQLGILQGYMTTFPSNKDFIVISPASYLWEYVKNRVMISRIPGVLPFKDVYQSNNTSITISYAFLPTKNTKSKIRCLSYTFSRVREDDSFMFIFQPFSQSSTMDHLPNFRFKSITKMCHEIVDTLCVNQHMRIDGDYILETNALGQEKYDMYDIEMYQGYESYRTISYTFGQRPIILYIHAAYIEIRLNDNGDYIYPDGTKAGNMLYTITGIFSPYPTIFKSDKTYEPMCKSYSVMKPLQLVYKNSNIENLLSNFFNVNILVQFYAYYGRTIQYLYMRSRYRHNRFLQGPRTMYTFNRSNQSDKSEHSYYEDKFMRESDNNKLMRFILSENKEENLIYIIKSIVNIIGSVTVSNVQRDKIVEKEILEKSEKEDETKPRKLYLDLNDVDSFFSTDEDDPNKNTSSKYRRYPLTNIENETTIIDETVNENTISMKLYKRMKLIHDKVYGNQVTEDSDNSDSDYDSDSDSVSNMSNSNTVSDSDSDSESDHSSDSDISNEDETAYSDSPETDSEIDSTNTDIMEDDQLNSEKAPPRKPVPRRQQKARPKRVPKKAAGSSTRKSKTTVKRDQTKPTKKVTKGGKPKVTNKTNQKKVGTTEKKTKVQDKTRQNKPRTTEKKTNVKGKIKQKQPGTTDRKSNVKTKKGLTDVPPVTSSRTQPKQKVKAKPKTPISSEKMSKPPPMVMRKSNIKKKNVTEKQKGKSSVVSKKPASSEGKRPGNKDKTIQKKQVKKVSPDNAQKASPQPVEKPKQTLKSKIQKSKARVSKKDTQPQGSTGKPPKVGTQKSTTKGTSKTKKSDKKSAALTEKQTEKTQKSKGGSKSITIDTSKKKSIQINPKITINKSTDGGGGGGSSGGIGLGSAIGGAIASSTFSPMMGMGMGMGMGAYPVSYNSTPQPPSQPPVSLTSVNVTNDKNEKSNKKDKTNNDEDNTPEQDKDQVTNGEDETEMEETPSSSNKSVHPNVTVLSKNLMSSEWGWDDDEFDTWGNTIPSLDNNKLPAEHNSHTIQPNVTEQQKIVKTNSDTNSKLLQFQFLNQYNT